MKYIHDQRGVAFLLEIVLIAVVLAAIGFAGYGYYQGTHKAATNASPSHVAKASPTATPTPADPYAGWLTFAGTCSGFSFKHPSDWKTTLGAIPYEGQCQVTTAASPGGNKLMLVPGFYGDGPGCDWTDVYSGGKNDCPIIKTLKSEDLGMSVELTGVYLVEQVLCDDKGKCEGRVALAKPSKTVPKFTVGTSQRYPLVVFDSHAMFMTQGKQTSYGNPTIPILEFDEASARAWLKSDEVAQAELAMKSLSLK